MAQHAISSEPLLSGLVCSIVAASIAPGPAIAQTGSSSNPGKPALETIIVTAERTDSLLAEDVEAGSIRPARQIDTPFTVSVIPRSLLDAQQAAGLLDALRNAAGVTSALTSPIVYNNLAIRGIPVDNRSNYRLNGSLPVVNFIDLPLDDKERVEALKGASGLFYGFATPSGIVNLVMKPPPASPLATATISVNGFGQLQGHVDAGVTSGTLGVRINMAGGSIDPGIEAVQGHRFLVAASFKVEMPENFVLNVDAEQIAKKVVEPTIIQGPAARVSLLRTIPPLPSPNVNPGSRAFVNDAAESNLLARVSWTPAPDWNLTLHAGFSHARRDRRFSTLRNFDPEKGTGTLNVIDSDEQTYRTAILKFEVAKAFAAGGLIHELSLGASGQTQNQYVPQGTIIAGVANFASRSGCVRLGLPESCEQSAYNPIPLAAVLSDAILPFDPARDIRTRSKALYLVDRIKFGGPDNDRFMLLGGLRKTWSETSSGMVDGGRRIEFSGNPLSIAAAAIFRPVPSISIYASYIEGLEETIAAPPSAVNAGEILPASRSRQWETGAKIQLSPALMLTIAGFSIRRELTYNDSSNRFVKDGEARYRGIEASLAGEVTPSLSVYSSALILDARQGQSGDPLLIGKRIESSAPFQISLFASYRFAGRLSGLSLNAGAEYTGSRMINPENTVAIPGYATIKVGAVCRFRIGGMAMIARLNFDNVTGQRYYAGTGSNLFASAPPATIKFSLSFGVF